MSDYKSIDEISPEEIHDFFKRVNYLSHGKNFALNLSNFALSTLWLANAIFENGAINRRLLFDIINIFVQRECPSLSLTYVIFDDELKTKIINVLKKYSKTPKWFLSTMDNNEKFINQVSDELIINIYDRDYELHKHLIINIQALLTHFGKMQHHFDPKNEYPKLLAKYNILSPDNEFGHLAALSRSILLSMTKMIHNEGAGYMLSEAIILDDAFSPTYELLKPFNVEIIKPSQIPFDENMNILTGNGFSKYLSLKEMKDDWLQRQLPLGKIQNMILKRFLDLQNHKREMLKDINSSEALEELEKLNDEIKKYEIYILSNRFKTRIISYIESFAVFQAHFLNGLSKRKNAPFHINGDLFHKWLSEIAKTNNIQIHTKDRNYLFHSLFYIRSSDYFSNIETLLTIFDKFTSEPNKRISIEISDDQENYDDHYLLVYVFPESYLDYVWNNKKINSLPIQKIDTSFKNVYTLNYDNITDRLFKQAIHLHGSFNEIGEWNGKTLKGHHRHFERAVYFEGIEESYLRQIDTITNCSSTVLKGGDYKMEHIWRVCDEYQPFNFRQKFKTLSEQQGDFLVVGTLLVGDPHIFDLLGNKARNVYITYWSENEFAQILSLLHMSMITKRKWKIHLVKFQDLMHFWKL